jgi:hypothetical protein
MKTVQNNLDLTSYQTKNPETFIPDSDFPEASFTVSSSEFLMTDLAKHDLAEEFLELLSTFRYDLLDLATSSIERLPCFY